MRGRSSHAVSGAAFARNGMQHRAMTQTIGKGATSGSAGRNFVPYVLPANREAIAAATLESRSGTGDDSGHRHNEGLSTHTHTHTALMLSLRILWDFRGDGLMICA